MSQSIALNLTAEELDRYITRALLEPDEETMEAVRARMCDLRELEVTPYIVHAVLHPSFKLTEDNALTLAAQLLMYIEAMPEREASRG